MATRSFVVSALPSTKVIAFLDAIKNGKIYGLKFARRTPKCTACGRSLKSFIGKTHCHMCGGELSFERVSIAQKGVKKAPKRVNAVNSKSPAVVKAKYGLHQFYDRNAKNDDGTRGDYRSCGFDEIKSIRIDGVEYVIV